MTLSTRITEIFMIETDNAKSINVLDVLTDAIESKLPVVWKNYGQFRLVPILVLAEIVRLHDQMADACKRIVGLAPSSPYALHWDDCIILNDAQIMLLLSGQQALKESDDAPTSD